MNVEPRLEFIGQEGEFPRFSASQLTDLATIAAEARWRNLTIDALLEEARQRTVLSAVEVDRNER